MLPPARIDDDFSLVSGDWDDAREEDSSRSTRGAPRVALFRNFVLFCLLFSIAHATVDGVLAFSAAELGASLGSDGSSSLYFFYTFSALLFAKPALRAFGAKRVVLLGLIGLLAYVSSFFLALCVPGTSFVFLVGASIGGIGAGFLWTAQGSYYSINARAYAFASNDPDSSVALANFASIFASSYLLLETLFKLFATVIYLAKDRQGSWKAVVFGSYVSAAFCAIVAFSMCVKNLTPRFIGDGGGGTSLRPSPLSQEDHDAEGPATFFSAPGAFKSISFDEPVMVHVQAEAQLSDSLMLRSSALLPPTLWEDVSAVGRALLRSRRLQLLMPYQICFGLSSGFVNSYVMAKVVAVYLGDGYIGLMSALATLTAVILSWPYAHMATTMAHGKYYIMLLGGGCFVFGGLSVLCLTDAQMSSWPFLTSYFVIYGAARSAWESTNKAVVAQYFDRDDKLKDSAFAAVYFMSGLAGAFGFFFYKFMTRTQLAAINTVVPLVALACYHFSHIHAPEHLGEEEQGVVTESTETPMTSSSHILRDQHFDMK